MVFTSEGFSLDDMHRAQKLFAQKRAKYEIKNATIPFGQKTGFIVKLRSGEKIKTYKLMTDPTGNILFREGIGDADSGSGRWWQLSENEIRWPIIAKFKDLGSDRNGVDRRILRSARITRGDWRDAADNRRTLDGSIMVDGYPMTHSLGMIEVL